jgi:hypothetical protein
VFGSNGRFHFYPTSALGTLLSVTSGRFQEVEFLRPLSGGES